MRIHFIAIGGAVMHNLAIVLNRKGNVVTGSDDKIADPALSNLKQEGLLPTRIGFFKENITADIEAVILGMHARIDNEELLEAQRLGLKVFSFPEYIYEVAKEKKRVVIAGSHGKTSITSMVMHVLRACGLEFDYMVGAKVKGFDTAVKLTENAPIIILEGDEYLASPLNRESKFLFYHPHIALITGVAWDHINVFPVYADYVHQFERFAKSVEPGGTLVYYKEDKELQTIFSGLETDATVVIPYGTPEYFIQDSTTYLKTENGDLALAVFGEHNMQNIEGARHVCNALGVSNTAFYGAISSFEGAANRLQFIGKNEHTVIYKDFAHSPSKLKATVHAMKLQYPHRQLVACMELHTFSSINKEFLNQYANTMDEADIPVVFYDSETLQQKQMPDLNEKFVKKSFDTEQLNIFTAQEALSTFLLSMDWKEKNLLLMTSGTFAGMDLNKLSEQILKQ